MSANPINSITPFTGSDGSGRSEKLAFRQKEGYSNYIFLPDRSASFFHSSFLTDNIFFGQKIPVRCLRRALKLKMLYGRENIPYLLPCQIWKDRIIFKAVENFSLTFDHLIKSKNLNKETLQKAIDDILPQHSKGKIIIQDFDEMENFLKDVGYPREIINNYLTNYNSLNKSSAEGNVLYLNFKKAFSSPAETIDFKVDTEHELTHAMLHHLQNINNSFFYKDKTSPHFFLEAFNQVFCGFEDCFESKSSPLKKTYINKEKMLKYYGFESTEDLKKSFEKNLKSVFKETFNSDDYGTDFTKETLKELFGFLKYRAMDEKKAYQTNKKYRELNNDLNTPTKSELKPLLYEVMGEFFGQKESFYKDLCKNPAA